MFKFDPAHPENPHLTEFYQMVNELKRTQFGELNVLSRSEYTEFKTNFDSYTQVDFAGKHCIFDPENVVATMLDGKTGPTRFTEVLCMVNGYAIPFVVWYLKDEKHVMIQPYQLIKTNIFAFSGIYDKTIKEWKGDSSCFSETDPS